MLSSMTTSTWKQRYAYTSQKTKKYLGASEECHSNQIVDLPQKLQTYRDQENPIKQIVKRAANSDFISF